MPFNPPEVTHAYWSSSGLEKGKKISFPKCNQYKLMVEDFVAKASSGVTSNFSISHIITKTINEIQVKVGLLN